MTARDADLHFLTIQEAGELFRSGELSPVDITRACLERIEATDDDLRSFILVYSRTARWNRRASPSPRCCAASFAG